MNLITIIKKIDNKTTRPARKTLESMWRWKRLTFNEAPPIFGNSKPKSGSHLLLQVLNGFTQIMPYAYTQAEPIRTIRYFGGKRTQEEISADLNAIPKGVIGWGYIEATPENLKFLNQPGRVNFFNYRDPRDVLVSHVFYATDMHPLHQLHELYNSLPDFGSRLKVAINGIDRDGMRMVGVRGRYDAVFRWLDTGNVMCLRFEDLINNRESTLNGMLDYIENSTGYKIPTPRSEAIPILVKAIQPRKSHTFRGGRTGDWRNHFTEEHKNMFKEAAGNLLVELGYEKNNDW